MVTTDINMENKLDKIKNAFETLVYIVESNVNKKLIQEIELDRVNYDERYNILEATIIIKTFCEDPDVGSFNHIVDRADTELINVITQYDFNSNGKLKKVAKSVGSYLMVLFVGCKWENMGDSDLYMTYQLIQDEYNDTE